MACPRNRLVAAALCVLMCGGVRAWGVDEASVASLTGVVRRAVLAPPGQVSDSVLVALRQLHDERLRPLFAEMASRNVAAARLHGIFGLADLSDDGKVNIVQIASLSSRELRARALGAAMGADYLTPDQMRQVLAWPELEPSMELLVMGRLLESGDEPDAARLREIVEACGADEVASRVFAELLLAQVEGDADAKAAQATIDGLGEARREAMLSFAYAQILIERLSVRGFVVAEHDWAMTRPALRLQALATLISVDPELGLSEWRAAYEREADLSERIRLALVLLNAVDHVDASAFDPLIGSEVELLDRMGRAGRSVASGEGQEEALWALMRQNHERSLAWVFDAIDRMPAEARAPLLRAMLDRGMDERRGAGRVPAAFYEIARTLESTEPGAMAPYLVQAAERSDAPLCEAFLSAVMECEPHEVWDEGVIRSWPSRRCRVLASIAEARAGRTLDEARLELLVSAGKGGEELPPSFRVQAAWLALCQLQKEREALAEVLAPSDD